MPTIPYVKQTWTEDASLCNAARNNVHENGLYELSYAPAVRVYRSVAMTITTGTPTAIGFDLERFDQCANTADTMHDNVTNNTRLTCRYAGIYQISGSIEWAANPVTGILAIRHQGTTLISRNGGVSDTRYMAISTLYALAVNEYVELLATQISGANVNINASGNYSAEFGMVRVG